MRDSSSIRGHVFWPVAIIGGGLFILIFFVVAGQSQALAIGASLSFIVLAFASLLAGAGRTTEDAAPVVAEAVVVDDTPDDPRPPRTSDWPEPEDPPAPDITADEDPLN